MQMTQIEQMTTDLRHPCAQSLLDHPLQLLTDYKLNILFLKQINDYKMQTNQA
ncbi:hypothetical protein M2133_000567 [Parabacteroides sp. PF5-6]|nr:hypothetical protein [Parabacteroides sp. PF5-6]